MPELDRITFDPNTMACHRIISVNLGFALNLAVSVRLRAGIKAKARLRA